MNKDGAMESLKSSLGARRPEIYFNSFHKSWTELYRKLFSVGNAICWRGEELNL